MTADGGKPRKQRQHEARGLPGAGLRTGEEIATLQHGRDRLHLDGIGRGVALSGHGAN